MHWHTKQAALMLFRMDWTTTTSWIDPFSTQTRMIIVGQTLVSNTPLFHDSTQTMHVALAAVFVTV